jgi:hypothetical protein
LLRNKGVRQHKQNFVTKNGPLLPDHFPKLTWSGGIYLPETVEAPKQYQKQHPDRVKKFPAGEPPEALPANISEGWRPDLDHEVESAYWVLFYWLMSAPPVNLPDEEIEVFVWGGFNSPSWQT